MPRPEVIRRERLERPPFLTRVRRHIDQTWYEHRLARKKIGFRRRRPAVGQKTVALILGCQRSGTTMVQRTLDRLMDVDKFEEHDQRAFRDCRIVGREVRNALIERSTAQCVLFKPICDSHLALDLFADHPESKVIWIYRDYRDVANSSIAYWGDQAKLFIEDLLDGGGDWGVSQWNREKVTEACLRELGQACSEGLTPHGGCALFWWMRNDLFFTQSLQSHPDVLLVRYEDAVERPNEEFERMCRFLGLRFDSAIVARVFATSVRKREFPAIGARIRDLCQGLLDRLDESRRAVD